MRTPLLKDVGTGDRTPGGLIVPAARAYRFGGLSMSNGVWVKVPLDTRSFDPAGCFDITNGRYVCPVAGDYQVAGELHVTSNATGQSMSTFISRNGTVGAGNTGLQGTTVWSSATTQDMISLATGIMFCAAGDYLELWGLMNGASLSLIGLQNDYNNYLAVAKVV